MKRNIKSHITLTRPVNCLITFLAVWAGALVSSDIYFTTRILLASLSAALIAAYGNALNDIFDIRIDRFNKPHRPLASGKISMREAITTAMICGFFGLALSFLISGHAVVIAVLAVVSLTIYTPHLKGLLFTGNIMVALICAMAFIYGGIAVENPFGALILAIYAFLLHLGREMIKDVEDFAADNRNGKRTGAAIDRTETSRTMAGGVFLLLIILTLIPFITGRYGLGYFLMVIVGVDSILIFSITKLVRTGSPGVMRRIAALLKVAMPIGLLAVFLGSRGL